LTHSVSGTEGICRRTLLAGAGGAALALSLGIVPLHSALAADSVPMDELMKPGELSELALGPADAKVVVVEYASMTCGHCARFHTTVFPELKEKYIDTNKIRFVMREFPLDNLAAAASMLARCSGDDKAFAMINVLFDRHADWAYVKSNPVPALMDIAKQAGFTQETFEQCLADQKTLDAIEAVRQRAAEKFGVNSTPTFFINGKIHRGALTIDELEKEIQPYLKS